MANDEAECAVCGGIPMMDVECDVCGTLVVGDANEGEPVEKREDGRIVQMKQGQRGDMEPVELECPECHSKELTIHPQRYCDACAHMLSKDD